MKTPEARDVLSHVCIATLVELHSNIAEVALYDRFIGKLRYRFSLIKHQFYANKASLCVIRELITNGFWIILHHV